MSEQYRLNTRDNTLVSAAMLLLRKVSTARITKPGQLMTATKLLHILTKLPAVPPGGYASVMVVGPYRRFGEIKTSRWWEVVAEGRQLRVSSGGYFFRPSSGGDSFTAMTWSALPEAATEYYDDRRSLLIVPDLQPFPEEIANIEFASGGYSFEIYDDDNPGLEDNEDPVDADDEE